MMMPPPPKKEERVKLREQELVEKCKKEQSLEKQEQMHLEQVEKHEHNLEQRALCAERAAPIQATLPAPREPLQWVMNKLLLLSILIWRPRR